MGRPRKTRTTRRFVRSFSLLLFREGRTTPSVWNRRCHIASVWSGSAVVILIRGFGPFRVRSEVAGTECGRPRPQKRSATDRLLCFVPANRCPLSPSCARGRAHSGRVCFPVRHFQTHPTTPQERRGACAAPADFNLQPDQDFGSGPSSGSGRPFVSGRKSSAMRPTRKMALM